MVIYTNCDYSLDCGEYSHDYGEYSHDCGEYSHDYGEYSHDCGEYSHDCGGIGLTLNAVVVRNTLLTDISTGSLTTTTTTTPTCYITVATTYIIT